MLLDKIKKYIESPDNALYNYDIAKEYEKLNQYSSACGFFLRAADQSTDMNFTYDCIIGAARSLIEHGDSFKMSYFLLEKAINLIPERQDAYYFVSLSHKYTSNHMFEESYKKYLQMKQNSTKGDLYEMIDLRTIEPKNIQIIDTVRESKDQKQKDFRQKIQKEYTNATITPSDINEHVPVLYEISENCNHITEMGVRSGVSTRAFLMTNAKLVCYDIVEDQNVVELIKEAREFGKDVSFIKADVLKIDIEETDLLFIDTLHTYGQLKEELNRHANKVKKYIAFHDTNTYGLKNEVSDTRYEKKQGLIPAIIEFLIENKSWRFKKFLTNNNGLTILEKESAI